MSEKRYVFGGVNAAYVVSADGTRTPIGAPNTVQIVTSRGKGADKVYKLEDMDMSMTFEVPVTAETQAFFDDLFMPMFLPTSAYKLDAATGRVYVDGRRVNVNGISLDARWYFIDQLDRAVWRWALKTGLQLEDAVRELNRIADKERP